MTESEIRFSNAEITELKEILKSARVSGIVNFKNLVQISIMEKLFLSK
jgi:hypothetical protein